MRAPLHVRLRQLPLELEDYLALAAATLLPWAFGGVEIWASRSAALLLVSAASVALFRNGWGGLGLDRNTRWLLPALLLGVWGALQLLPLPAAVVRTITPGAAEVYRATFPGYGAGGVPDVAAALEAAALAHVPEAAGIPPPARPDEGLRPEIGGRWSGWRPISLLPAAGLDRLMWYVALGLGFVFVRRRCADPEVARLYASALLALFAALALFGLVQHATANGKLYWIRPILESTRNPFGPYVNPTHFAGVMELGVPWLAGFAIVGWRRERRLRPRDPRTPLFAAAALICFVAALATASKSSGLLIFVGLVALAWIAATSWRARLLSSALAAGAALTAAAALRFTELGSRLDDFLRQTGGQVEAIERLVAWPAGLRMWRDFAWCGSGFGSFRDVIPHYLPFGNTTRWARLHNDYLEFLVEGGVIGAVLLIWLVVAYWSRVLRPRRRRVGSDLEYVGLVVGLLTLSVHAGFDFNHQIPANALLFTTMAAVAVARAEATSPDEEVP